MSGVIGFAHRGAPLTKKDENTLAAFERALSLGATGLETDIGLTADGVPVLIHSGLSLRRGPAIARLRRRALPPHIPSLADLYDRCGHDFELSLDMAQPRAVEAAVRLAGERGAVDRLWLNYWNLPVLETWRHRWPQLHLVYPTLPLLPGRAARLITQLADLRIDALNVPHRFCTKSLIERAHRHGLAIFAWGIHRGRALERVIARGVDGVYCDDVEDMVNVIATRA